MALHAVGTQRREHLVPGTVAGKGVRALVDTCADANIISAQLAAWYKIEIDEDPGAQVEFQRVDGSRIQSKGIVRDLEWAFAADGASHKLDFYVLDDVDYHIILGKDFLFSSNAFQKYPNLLRSKRRSMDGMYVLHWVGGKSNTPPLLTFKNPWQPRPLLSHMTLLCL
jgi:hypothetical protein